MTENRNPMKKIVMLLTAAFVIILWGGSAEAQEAPPFDDGSVIVVLKSQYPAAQISSEGRVIPNFEEAGVSDIDVLMSRSVNRISAPYTPFSAILKLNLGERGYDSVQRALEKLREDPRIKYAEPNGYVTLCDADDPYYTDGSQYSLEKVRASEVWDLGIDCSGTTVATIDSGARVSHEDLSDNLRTNPGEIPGNGTDDDGNGYTDDVHGYNFVSGNADLTDNVGHGTHVAGIIAAATNNSKGVASLSRNAKVALLKAFDTRTTTVDMIIKAIDYAQKSDIRIINASFTTEDQTFTESIKAAVEACPNILFVCATGNHGANLEKRPEYPACYDLPNVIAVSNSTSDDVLSSSSNYGAESADIAAPGAGIYSTYKTSDNSYGLMSGTSMAAPLVSSVAAVILSANPRLSASEIADIITENADRVPALEGKIKNAARLNASKAVTAALAARPSAEPEESAAPSEMPSTGPEESAAPSEMPSTEPIESAVPSEEPSFEPEESAAPSEMPPTEPEESATPSEEPSREPIESAAPSEEPSLGPRPTQFIPPTETPTSEPLSIISGETNPEGSLVTLRIGGVLPKGSVIWAAAYTESGVMTDFTYLKPRIFSENITLPLDSKTADIICVSVWDGFRELTPLCDKYIMNLNNTQKGAGK